MPEATPIGPADRAPAPEDPASGEGSAFLVAVLTLDGTLLALDGSLSDWPSEPSSLVGRRLWDLPLWSRAPGAAKRLRELLAVAARGAVAEDEVGYTDPRGEKHAMRLALTPVRGADGTVAQIVSHGLDLSDSQRMREALARREAELRVSEQNFRTLADNMSQFAWMADEKGWIFWYNKRWFEYTGTTLAEMQGLGWKRVHHPDHIDRVLSRMQRSWDTGEPWEDTFPLRGRNGRYRWFLSRALPIRDREGRIVRWFGTNTDVTERKLAEDRLREEDRRKDEFLATLAHELRNPLAPLRNAAELLREAGGDPQATERGRGMIERQVTQLVRLVDDLLDVSRITTGKLELRLETTSLADVVESALETSEPAVRASGQALRVCLPDEPIRLRADPTRLAQVLVNLVNNAAKYGRRGGEVTLAVERGGDEVTLAVSDAGIGIDPEERERIFELFVQIEQSAPRAQGGLGIGLTLSKRLVDMHGGRLSVESEGPGHGSTFRVVVPCLPAGDDSSEPGAPAEQAPPRAPGTRVRRVLVVDDNVDAAVSLQMLLELRGCEVEVAHDGLAALELALRLRPELILLDLGLPGLDGFGVASELRAMPEFECVRLVALTGWGQEEDRLRSREAGFDLHFVKPLDPAQLERLLAGD